MTKSKTSRGKKKSSTTPKGEYKELLFESDDDALLQDVLGGQDATIKAINEKLSVEVGRSKAGLVLQGQDADVDLAHNLLSQLWRLHADGHRFFPGDVPRAIDILCADRHSNLAELFRETVRIRGRKHMIVPKTFTQKKYLDSIRDHDIVFGVGPAGTGKTYLAMAMAVAALMRKEYKRIVLCRPAVEAGEKLGFLPGDMAEKVNPYLRPLYDALHDMVDFAKAEELIEKGFIEVAPLAFMRGRTLSNAFVILDEAQNTSEVQMKMLLTRIGQGSKCVITGDGSQIDLPRGMRSGLVQALRILRDTEGIDMIEFSRADVIRHAVVSRIIQAYEQAGLNDD